MNFAAELAGLRQRTSGRGSNPRSPNARTIREWLGYTRKRPPMVRVASPTLTQAIPPSTRTRFTSSQTSSRTACMRSNAASPSPASRCSPIAGSRSAKRSSHISIMGYGGDVTTSSTESSSISDIERASPTWTRWVVSIRGSALPVTSPRRGPASGASPRRRRAPRARRRGGPRGVPAPGFSRVSRGGRPTVRRPRRCPGRRSGRRWRR